MSAKIISFPGPVQGPISEREAIIVAARELFAKRFGGKRLSDDLAAKLADAIIAAPAKTE